MFLNKGQPIITKKKKTTISSTVNRSKFKLEKSPTSWKGRKTRRNYFRRTYFGRFILRRRIHYRKVLSKPSGIALAFKLEETSYNFSIKSKRNRRYYRILEMKGRLHPIKPFRLGFLTVVSKKRNFFAAIHERTPGKNFANKLLFKTSVGLLGYAGPKRGTNLGRERVGFACSGFLRRNKFSYIDLVFPRRVTRWFSFFFKGLRKSTFWVRRIHIVKQRSHGFTRGKKIRRK